MRSLPGLYDVRNSLQSETPELQISLKPGAERFGLTLSEVTRQVRQAFYGDEAQRLPRDGEDVRVIAYKSADAVGMYDPLTLREARLHADEFYSVLERWREAFQLEWNQACKVPKGQEGITLFDVTAKKGTGR